MQGRVAQPGVDVGRQRRGLVGEPLSAVWSDPSVPTGRQGLAYQATALASYVDAGLRDSPLHSLADSRSLLATIEATRASLTVV